MTDFSRPRTYDGPDRCGLCLSPIESATAFAELAALYKDQQGRMTLDGQPTSDAQEFLAHHDPQASLTIARGRFFAVASWTGSLADLKQAIEGQGVQIGKGHGGIAELKLIPGVSPGGPVKFGDVLNAFNDSIGKYCLLPPRGGQSRALFVAAV